MPINTEQQNQQLKLELIAAKQKVAELESKLALIDADEHLLTLLDSLPGARRLRTLIDNLPGIAYRCLLNDRWNMDFISTDIEDFTGYSASDFLHNNIRSFSSVVHPDDVSIIQEAVEKALSSKQAYTIDYRMIHSNGSILWVYEKGQGVFDDKGVVQYLDGIILDNTEKHNAFKSLVNSESRFQNIIDASPVPYALNDEQNNIIYLNRAFISVFGYDLNDIPNLDEWWPKAYPDEEYRNYVSTSWTEHLEDSKINNKPFEPLEISIQCKNGEYRTVLASAAALTGKYENIHLVILYDITERKLAEEKLNETVNLLENIVNSTPDLIFVKDKNLKTIFCNEAYARCVGKKRKAMYGLTDIENGWDAELVNGNSSKGIRGFKHDDLDALSGLDVHNPNDPVNIDGQVHIFDTHKMPLIDEDGNTIGVLGVARDVTQAKQTELQLRQSQKMEAIGKLTGGIAHDFNNMLGVILGYSELAKNIVSHDPRLSNYIQQIYSAGNRAKLLTSKLLAFSRKQISVSKPCSINLVLLRDKAMLEKTLTAKIQFEMDLQKDLWLTLIDEDMFADSILNVCINSMHAMPGGGKLEISTENIYLDDEAVSMLDVAKGDYVKITIKDYGVGIESTVLEKVFEPFFSTKGESGTGLGMSQVYGFVKQSRGGIYILSTVGEGASVAMCFPRYTQSNTADSTESVFTNEDVSSCGNETILVVDDEESLRELTEELLSGCGYQVLVAENAKVALEILNEQSVDLLLSDVIMPEMDGYQLATLVREKYPEIKIQMVSGYNDTHFTNEADDKLKKNQINKPFSKDQLFKKIRHLLAE